MCVLAATKFRHFLGSSTTNRTEYPIGSAYSIPDAAVKITQIQLHSAGVAAELSLYRVHRTPCVANDSIRRRLDTPGFVRPEA